MDPMKQTILILLGIVVGLGLLSILGCYLYYYKEDQKLDCEFEHTLAHLKNLRAKKWCLDAIDRALDDALFWNDLSTIYLEAGLLYEGRRYYSMAYDILDGIAGRYDKPIMYVPRGPVLNSVGDAK